jgi:hypothetical protein
MKKLHLLFLMMISLPLFCCAQDLKTNLDYQYKRVEGNYSAYATYLNAEETTISLALYSNYKLQELQSIKIKYGKKYISVPFSKLDITVVNDDKSLNSLVVKLDLSKVLVEKIECETTITFLLIDGNKIELPFMFCKLKDGLKL